MSERIVLISVNRHTTPYPVYPLGVSYIAAALQEAGHLVELIDLACGPEQLQSAIQRFNPGYIGISLRNIDDIRIDKTRFFVPELDAIRAAIRSVSRAPLIVGGSAYSLFPERLLDILGADYGIAGEGEAAIVELLDALAGGGAPESLKAIGGLVYRDHSGIRTNPSRDGTAFSKVKPFRGETLVSWYLKKSSMLNIQTQRGCAFTCCYCTYPLIEGRSFRRRDPGDVAEEFASLGASGARYLFVVDSVFNTSADHVAGISEALIKNENTVSWGCFLRPSGISPDLMRMMARAGMKHIEFGSDSFCDEVLAAYGKGFTFDQIRESSEMARNENVHYAHFLILGGPAESERTLAESFNNSRALKKTAIFPFVGMRLYPGTPLFYRALHERIVDASTDFLEPVFYISPLVRKERIDALKKSFREQSPNWIIEDLPPAMTEVMDGLRQRGVTGPMWEFLAQ